MQPLVCLSVWYAPLSAICMYIFVLITQLSDEKKNIKNINKTEKRQGIYCTR